MKKYLSALLVFLIINGASTVYTADSTSVSGTQWQQMDGVLSVAADIVQVDLPTNTTFSSISGVMGVDGNGNIFSSDASGYIQTVFRQYTAVKTGVDAVNIDATPHLASEGDVFMEATITPVSADSKLLEALLLPIDKPTTRSGQANLQKLNKRMNLWLMGTGKLLPSGQTFVIVPKTVIRPVTGAKATPSG
jgi:hypothetical protein